MESWPATEVVIRQFGDLLESTPEGVFRMDRLHRAADVGLLKIARESGLGLIEACELRDAVDAHVDRLLLGVPSDAAR